MIFTMPLPQMLATMMMAMATSASHQQVLGIADGGPRQIQTDQDDYGAGDDGREEPHDLLRAHQLEQQRQHQIQQARHHDTAHGVGQLVAVGHGGVLPSVEGRHGLEAAQIRKGRAQEGGDLQLSADVEQQRAETGKQQRGLDGQGQTVAAAPEWGPAP